MNQILVTEKLYITPEIKRKKKLYKFEFFISLVVVCVLSSYYIYAEYNKNKDEAVSQEILAGANIVGEDQTTKPTEKLVVMLDNDVNTVGTEDDSFRLSLFDHVMERFAFKPDFRNGKRPTGGRAMQNPPCAGKAPAA